MVDLLFVVITLVIFAAVIGFEYGCELLMGTSR
jgi:hypothetical protein